MAKSYVFSMHKPRKSYGPTAKKAQATKVYKSTLRRIRARRAK